MERFCRVFTKIFSTVLIGAVVLLALALVGVRLFGLTPYTVLSGSMEPTYPVGSVIYVKAVDPETLSVGDPITFRLDGTAVATHRIIEITKDERGPGFRTKGDANDTADGVTPAEHVIGKPVFCLPLLGYGSAFVQRPAGLLCVVGLFGASILLSFAVELLFPEKKGDQTE